MKEKDMSDIKEKYNLSAPCGVFCGSCRHYLAFKKKMEEQVGLRRGCEGCRIRNKNCAFIKKGCSAIRKGEYLFCYECSLFPCDNLKNLDARHKTNYGDSPIANLLKIKEIGVEKWLNEQKTLYTCPKCHGELSVHDDVCFDCGYKFNPHKKSDYKK